MRKPTVHLNGTSRRELENQLTEAGSAVYLAMRKLNEAAPNARDYYPQGEGVFSEAMREHAARMTKLADVYRDLSDLLEAVINTEVK